MSAAQRRLGRPAGPDAMTTPKRILIVEDEADLAELLGYNLRRAGYETEVARDGQTAVRRVTEGVPDLVVLDVMLPQLSGLQVAKQIRTNPKTASIPIVMLTAKAEEVDQVAGLQGGADDYVTKPFSIKILLARIEAMLRRTRPGSVTEAPADVIEVGAVRVDLSTHTATARGEQMKLTLTEMRLLVALMRARGKVLNRADLMYSAMGPDVLVTTRTIDVHVASIRKKLGDLQGMIRTVRGVGYLLSDEVSVGTGEDDAGEP